MIDKRKVKRPAPALGRAPEAPSATRRQRSRGCQRAPIFERAERATRPRSIQLRPKQLISYTAHGVDPPEYDFQGYGQTNCRWPCESVNTQAPCRLVGSPRMGRCWRSLVGDLELTGLVDRPGRLSLSAEPSCSLRSETNGLRNETLKFIQGDEPTCLGTRV